MKLIVKLTLVAAYSIVLLNGCKKNKTPKDEFSFTYNGQKYQYTSVAALTGMDVRNGFNGTPSVKITLPGFDGEISFEKTGCACYLPKLVRLDNILPACVISYSSTAYGAPIDSSKIYQYSSGSLNITSSNCKTSTEVILGVTFVFTRCDVNGTFNLELKNRNNERIVIMNGIVRLHAKIM